MPSIVFELTGLPPSANKRLHYMARAKANKEWKGWAIYAATDAANRSRIKGLPWARVHVLYTFHYPRVTRVDRDNLTGSAKPVLDGMKGILIVDDDHSNVHRLTADVEVRRGIPSGLVVTVEPCLCES